MKWWPWHRHRRQIGPGAAEAERQLEALEARADRVAGSLRERMRRNSFAEGIGAAWGAKPR